MNIHPIAPTRQKLHFVSFSKCFISSRFCKTSKPTPSQLTFGALEQWFTSSSTANTFSCPKIRLSGGTRKHPLAIPTRTNWRILLPKCWIQMPEVAPQPRKSWLRQEKTTASQRIHGNTWSSNRLWDFQWFLFLQFNDFLPPLLFQLRMKIKEKLFVLFFLSPSPK